MSKQKLSLQEQLLKSGLVSNAKAKSIKSDKRKQEQQVRNNKVIVVDEAKELAKQALAEKVERDRELNLAKKQIEEQKQLAAQVKQLIELNKQARDAEGHRKGREEESKEQMSAYTSLFMGRVQGYNHSTTLSWTYEFQMQLL